MKFIFNPFTNNLDWVNESSGGTVTGSGSAGQVAFWNSSTGIAGDSALFWDSTNHRLGIGGATASSKLTFGGVVDGSQTSIIDFKNAGGAVVGSISRGSSGQLLLQNASGNATIDWQSQYLFDPASAHQAINWNLREAYDSSAVSSIHWNGRTLIDGSNNSSVDWSARILQNASGVRTVDWDGMLLQDTTSNQNSVDWQNRLLIDALGGTLVDYSGTILDNNSNPAINFGGEIFVNGVQLTSDARQLTGSLYLTPPLIGAGSEPTTGDLPGFWISSADGKPHFWDGSADHVLLYV